MFLLLPSFRLFLLTHVASDGKTKMLGTLGDFGSYSFYFSHHITSGEGGMVTCKTEQDFKAEGSTGPGTIIPLLRDPATIRASTRCGHSMHFVFGHVSAYSKLNI